MRMEPDGVSTRVLTLSFPRDVTGNSSDNNASPPYRSIGYTGCQQGLADGCGPDNEDGRGILTSFTLAGQEWLLVAGARSGGDLDYVYVTRDTGAALSFSYVDLSQLLGGNTRGISAARAIGGRLYLGFPDDGGSCPYGTAVLSLAPTGPDGLDAVKGVATPARARPPARSGVQGRPGREVRASRWSTPSATTAGASTS
jgi:hypothetical protein